MSEIFPLSRVVPNAKLERVIAGVKPEPNLNDTEVPLCVDLDGTLIRTDMLFESLFVLLKRNPLYLFLLPLWLLRGRAFLKQAIAQRVALNTSCLPFNNEFLQYLKHQHQRGRALVLATACPRPIAEQIARELGIFTHVLATDGEVNLSGERKRELLCKRFGVRGFDYAGNAAVDMKIWRDARASIIVNAPTWLSARAQRMTSVAQVFNDPRGLLVRARIFLKAIRVHQWVKNLLVFVPLLTSHNVGHIPLLAEAALAFLAFSLCSSSVYLLNDLLDLEADRLHATKRRRPFAAGLLSIQAGMLLIPGLLLTSVAIAVTLSPAFLYALTGYFILTVAYSFYLKQIAVVDTLLLAILYTARIVAGAAAIGVALSMWLLAFSLFLFLSLAYVKRYSELHVLCETKKEKAKGRGYLAKDLEQISNLGATSGYIAVLVLALYINSEEVTALYSRPQLLWLVCPLILYWISRVWLLAHRGQMHQDPIVFALKDKVSYALGVAAGLIMLFGV